MIQGFHHITAIASNAQKNIDFYTKILGLRLVKLTVNFDDPESYHLYYADEIGSPGSIITFFIWPLSIKARHGSKQINSFGLRIPKSSISFWMTRLTDHKIEYSGPLEKFGNRYLLLKDPDNINIELVGVDEINEYKSYNKVINKEFSARGIYNTTLWVDNYRASEDFLTQVLKLKKTGEEEFIHQYSLSNKNNSFIELRNVQGFWEGSIGKGSIHHVAFDVGDTKNQLETSNIINKTGINTTDQIDRKYFKSIYFREPGGVLFEIATKNPGFTVDEKIEELGSKLMLPAQYESQRDNLVKILPKINLE